MLHDNSRSRLGLITAERECAGTEPPWTMNFIHCLHDESVQYGGKKSRFHASPDHFTHLSLETPLALLKFRKTCNEVKNTAAVYKLIFNWTIQAARRKLKIDTRGYLESLCSLNKAQEGREPKRSLKHLLNRARVCVRERERGFRDKFPETSLNIPTFEKHVLVLRIFEGIYRDKGKMK